MPLIRALDPLDMAGVTPVTPSTLAAEDAAQAQGQIAQLKLTQEQHAQQRQNAFRASLAQLGKSPSSTAYTQLMMQYPEFAEGMSPILKQMGSQEAAAEASAFQSQALPAYHAFLNKRPDLAASHLDDLARAYANAGNASKAQQIAGLAKAARENPDVASGTLGAMLAGSMGHENYDAMLKGAGFLKQQEKVEKEIGKLGADTLQAQRSTLSEAEVADRGQKARAEREDAQTQARLRGGLMGSQIAQNNASAVASTAQAGLAGAQTARVNEQRPAELRALEADATSKAAAAAEATRLERARADRAVADAAAAGAVPPDLLRRQAEAKAKEDEARAKYADQRFSAEASSAKSEATMKEFNLLNAQADLDRRRQLELLKIKELENKVGPEFEQQRALAKAQIRDINFKQDVMREQTAQKWQDLELDKQKHAARMREVWDKSVALDGEARKMISADVKGAMESIDTAQNADRLITQVRNNIDYGGAIGWGAEQWRAFWGADEQATATRRMLNNFNNREILKNIPPGSLTEKERDIVAKGFPTDYSNPQLIMDYLQEKRDVALRVQAIYEAAADWKSGNSGSDGTAQRDLIVGGKRVPKGTTFIQFIKEQRELAELHSMGGK